MYYTYDLDLEQDKSRTREIRKQKTQERNVHDYEQTLRR